MNETKYFDRNGTPLEVGQRVTVQHCTGRYGRTTKVTGTLTHIGRYGDVNVDTGKQGEGNCMYPGFSLDATLGPNCQRGYDEHVDFEHGHKTWIEVVPA